MPIQRSNRPRIFLDSSILITAILSTRGGSFYLLARDPKLYRFFINEYVLQEAIRALHKKFPELVAPHQILFELLATAHVQILPNPPQEAVHRVENVLRDHTDAPILASALSQCQILLTMDHDFLTPTVLDYAHNYHLKICKPEEFLKQAPEG